MKYFKLLMIISLVTGIYACSQQTDLSVSFDTPQKLSEGAKVYLDGQAVGEVSKISNTNEAMVVTLDLEPESIKHLRSGSAAIVNSKNGEQIVEIYNYRSGKEVLKAGDQLIGLNNLLEYAAWQAGEAIDAGKQSAESALGSVSEYFNSDEWQQQKQKMNDQMAKLQQDLGQAFEESRQAIDQLLQDLEAGSDQAREETKKSYEELSAQLKTEIERLRKQGKEQLIDPLKQLLDELSRAMEENQDSKSI